MQQDATVVVTIGRNVDGVPMSPGQWQTFMQDVNDWAATAFTDVYFRGEGWGHSEQWGTEVAFTVVGAFPDWRVWSDHRDALDRLREQYGQEAVAVIWGTTTFV